MTYFQPKKEKQRKFSNAKVFCYPYYGKKIEKMFQENISPLTKCTPNVDTFLEQHSWENNFTQILPQVKGNYAQTNLAQKIVA